MKIRGKTIAYASNKKKESRREEELFLNIGAMEENSNETNTEEYENKRDELKRLRQKMLEHMVIRPRVNLESRHYVSNAMPSIRMNTEDAITDQSGI